MALEKVYVTQIHLRRATKEKLVEDDTYTDILNTQQNESSTKLSSKRSNFLSTRPQAVHIRIFMIDNDNLGQLFAIVELIAINTVNK